MHEFSLVQALMAQLDDLARDHGADQIHDVHLEIGPLSGVVIDSFEFAFNVLAKEKPLTSRARLHITVPPQAYDCLDCQFALPATNKKPEKCPRCGRMNLYPQGGDQIILRRVEMDEAGNR